MVDAGGAHIRGPRRTPSQGQHLAAASLLACTGIGAALLAIAMALYPGGTWIDPQAQGHDFWRNFICDLTHATALNGAPNRGATPAQAAMLVMVPALGLFWVLVPRLFEGRARLGTAIRMMGLVSVAGLVAVPLIPSVPYGLLHSIAVLMASVPGLMAATLSVLGLRARPALRLLGAVTLLAGAVDAALYTRGVLVPAPTPVVMPALQKVAALGLLTWMAAVGVGALRLRAPAS